MRSSGGCQAQGRVAKQLLLWVAAAVSGHIRNAWRAMQAATMQQRNVVKLQQPAAHTCPNMKMCFSCNVQPPPGCARASAHKTTSSTKAMAFARTMIYAQGARMR
jgi:hypothetical protein